MRGCTVPSSLHVSDCWLLTSCRYLGDNNITSLTAVLPRLWLLNVDLLFVEGMYLSAILSLLL